MQSHNHVRAKRFLLVANVCMALLLVVLLGIVVVNQLARPANPLAHATLYVAPNSNAARQADAWRVTQPDNAALMDRLAALPQAHWLTTMYDAAHVASYIQAAAKEHKVPVLVSYFLPQRDCGLYSAGGAENADTYRQFIRTLAAAIGSTRVIVILEPDAVAGMGGTNAHGQPCASDHHDHYTLLNEAVTTLKAQPGVSLYIDAGNSKWVADTAELASRLARANIAKADGFSLNVSNFQPTDTTIAYGEAVSRHLNGAHFVIDTSRNGNGAYENPVYPEQSWCNPPGRALGHYPTTTTHHDLVDAYLFIKRPGESDGTDPDPHKCFGGPQAGQWWPEYALGLVQRWPHALQPN